jgi:hypothetical protein
VKRKPRRLSEVQIASSDPALPLLAVEGGQGKIFTVRLPQGAALRVPSGFDPDELFTLLVVVQEALA